MKLTYWNTFDCEGHNGAGVMVSAENATFYARAGYESDLAMGRLLAGDKAQRFERMMKRQRLVMRNRAKA